MNDYSGIIHRVCASSCVGSGLSLFCFLYHCAKGNEITIANENYAYFYFHFNLIFGEFFRLLIYDKLDHVIY